MTILVCGEALYDFFQVAEATEAALSFDARVGGSPFNVAVGIARQKHPVALLTGMSNDMLGQRLFGRLVAENVGTEYLVRSGRRTTLSLVGLDATGQPDYAFYGVGSADVAVTPGDMPDLPDAVTALHFGSYSIAVAPAADAYASLADRYSDRFISLDPNVRPTIEPDMAVWRRQIDFLRPHCNLIKVSAEDLGMLYPGTDASVIASGWVRDGTELVIVTAGAEGATAFTATHNVHVPSQKIDVVDTVGAGDAFQATLLSSLLSAGAMASAANWAADLDLEKILSRSVRAGAIACSRKGADMPRPEEF